MPPAIARTYCLRSGMGDRNLHQESVLVVHNHRPKSSLRPHRHHTARGDVCNLYLVRILISTPFLYSPPVSLPFAYIIPISVFSNCMPHCYLLISQSIIRLVSHSPFPSADHLTLPGRHQCHNYPIRQLRSLPYARIFFPWAPQEEVV